MSKIVCVGLACLDHLFKVNHLPTGNGKFFAQRYVTAPGGPAAAASLTVAALGHEAVFLGRLGDDAVGREVKNLLEDRGVDARWIRLLEGQTSQVSSIVVDDAGERQIVNFSSSRLDPDPSWISEEMIAEADFLLADIRWPEGALRSLDMAGKYNVPCLIDVDISPVDISKLVQSATYAIFSEKGLEAVTGEQDPEKGLISAQRMNGSWVAVTMGEKGSFWLENGQTRHCPAESIEPMDTCGAGDVFHGAFAVAMVEQMKIEQAMRFAGAAAAFKCISFGGSMGVPRRSDVDRLLTGRR